MRHHINCSELVLTHNDLSQRYYHTPWWKFKKRYDLLVGMIVVREILYAIEERDYREDQSQSLGDNTNEILN